MTKLPKRLNFFSTDSNLSDKDIVVIYKRAEYTQSVKEMISKVFCEHCKKKNSMCGDCIYE